MSISIDLQKKWTYSLDTMQQLTFLEQKVNELFAVLAFMTLGMNMAALVRLCSRAFQQNAVSRQTLPLSAMQWYSGAAGSMENTLDVKHRIDDTRKRALLGGGQRRIDAQHKKVDVLYVCFVRGSVKPKVVLIQIYLHISPAPFSPP